MVLIVLHRLLVYIFVRLFVFVDDGVRVWVGVLSRADAAVRTRPLVELRLRWWSFDARGSHLPTAGRGGVVGIFPFRLSSFQDCHPGSLLSLVRSYYCCSTFYLLPGIRYDYE